MPNARSLAVLLLLASCVEASPPDAAPRDAGSSADAAPASCEPACGEGAECHDGECRCAAGFHDGGDGACVSVGSCSEGFAIRAGEEACRPIADVCEPPACAVRTGWEAGQCTFAPAPDGSTCEGTSTDRCVTRFACEAGRCAGHRPACGAIRPIVFVHGIKGSSAEFRVMADRLKAEGWPADYLYFFDAKDPAWGCNVDNAEAIRRLVQRALDETCAPRVDLVAHSMGSLSSRHFMKVLGGHELVNTYVTLGGPHHGLSSPCWSPLNVCVWKELCQSGSFLAQLNAPPAVVGKSHWVSIHGTADTTIPNESSILAGAENVSVPGVEHSGANGLLEHPAAHAEVLRVLRYDCWE